MHCKSSQFLLCLILSPFLFITCENSSSFRGADVQIRIENASVYSMKKIRVSFPDTVVNYGTLKPKENSEYVDIPRAYRYQAVEMSINGKTARFQPIDFVGEEFLERGFYTYTLHINDEAFESDSEFFVHLTLRSY